MAVVIAISFVHCFLLSNFWQFVQLSTLAGSALCRVISYLVLGFYTFCFLCLILLLNSWAMVRDGLESIVALLLLFMW